MTGTASPARSPTLGARFEALDALRGLALLWMAVYHFNFDLNHLGFIQPKQRFFVEPFWVVQRTMILSMFLFAAGASVAVATHRGQSWAAFLRRWWQIVAAAALVSLATWWADPRTWIWFGVLHGMAVMLLFTRGVARVPAWVLAALAVLAVTLPWWASLSQPAWRWLGLGGKPITADWVPLFPWIGVMLAGLLAGRWLLAHRPSWWVQPVHHRLQPLVTLGQWSLSFYLVHQPVFVGALSLMATLRA